MRGQLVERTWTYNPAHYAPPRYRRVCSYGAFVPEELEGFDPSLTGSTTAAVSEAEARVQALNASADPALEPLGRLLLRTESIASSKVEGMQVDARSLARSEARREAGQKVGREAAEVIANIDAMKLAVEEASGPDPLTIDQVVEIHRVLLENSPSARHAGVIRDDQNWIGGNDYNPCDADFVPPPPEEVGRLMNDLIVFMNDESQSPLVQAAIAHAQFETIHPFDDGNGRTGRALVQIIFRRRGLAPAYVPPVSIVLAANRDRYIAGLNAFRGGQEAEWIEAFAAATAEAAALAAGYLEDVQELQERWRQMLRESVSPRADAAAWAILDVLPAHPVISLPVASSATWRSRPAALQGIDNLASAGVLLPLSEGARNRSWEAAGLLDLLAGLDEARPR